MAHKAVKSIPRRLGGLERYGRPAGILFGVAVVLWLGRTALGSLGQVDGVRWRFDYGFLALSLVAHGVGTLLAIRVWQSVLAQLGHRSPLRANLRIYCSSNLLKRAPMVMAHLAGRAVLYQRRGASPAVTLSASAIEMVVSPVSGAASYLLLLPFSPAQSSGSTLAVLGVCAIGVALLHPAGLNRVLRIVGRRTGAAELQTIRVEPGRVVAWVAWHVAVVLLGGLVLFFLFRTVYPLPASALVVAVQAWGLAVAVGGVFFFVPGTLGVREGAVVVLLSALAPLPVAAAVALLFRLWVMACEAVWAVASLLAAREGTA